MKYKFLFAILLITKLAYSQNFYVIGATVHIGNGIVIDNAVIIVEDGKISEVVDATTVKLNTSFGPTIKAYGKHIYPGIIAPNTRIGLVEIDYVVQTTDYKEVGVFNPNVRSLIAYNTDSDVASTILVNGITHAQIVPQGGRISGSSSVVKLNGWNWEYAAVRVDDGIHVRWPARFTRRGWWANPGKITENEDYAKLIADIRAFLLEAKAYHELEIKSENINLKFEALEGVFNGDQNFYVHVQGAKEIIAAIDLVEELGIETMVIIGGKDAFEVADLIKEKDIPIILRSVHSLPSKNHSDIDEPYKLPAQLQKEGIRFCLAYKNAWEQRSLMFLAGTAAAYGLTKEEALASITKNTAEILGLDNLGTLEKGKNASFIISTGDILDMRTSIVEKAYIDGKEVDLNNKQKELHQKYIKKYKSEGKL